MIHVILGAPCSGKSTYIREHAKAGDLRIDFDLIAETLGSETKHDAKGLVRKAAFEAREGAIKAALKDPEAESWIIHTLPSAEALREYEEAGAEIIRLDVSKEDCIERAKADGRPEATFEAIEKYFAREKGAKMEKHLYKSFEMKADDSGKIAGFFSTYEKTPDSYGDIIEPGAFTKTLEKRKESGHPFPLCFNHDFSAVIGAVEAVEKENGPYVEGDFLDTQLGQDVRKMVQSGAIYQFSFAYDVLKRRDPSAEEKAAGVTNVLQEVEVYEVSVVTVPANQNAVITEVKTALEAEVKAGRRNNKSDEETIKQIIELANSLLETKSEPEDTREEEAVNDEKAAQEVNEASEELPEVGNSKKAEDLLAKINSMKGEL